MNRNIDLSQRMVDFENALRAKGLRITHQRTEVFKALLKLTDHPTAENVFHQVRKHLKSISLDTVYRTISTFEEHGLVHRVHYIDNASRLDINVSDHHHLVCCKCNKMEDFYWPEFDEMKPPKTISHWDQVNAKHVVISAVCSSCRSEK